jgi:hypothetical protein
MYQERQVNEQRLESVEVVGDVGDDHFHDFIREAASRCVRVVRVSGGAVPSRRLMLALPRRQTILIRVERFIPTVRMAQISERFARSGG